MDFNCTVEGWWRNAAGLVQNKWNENEGEVAVGTLFFQIYSVVGWTRGEKLHFYSEIHRNIELVDEVRQLENILLHKHPTTKDERFLWVSEKKDLLSFKSWVRLHA